MKYLMIENKGEISPLALTLMGASTKRGDSDKIGFFGSGNKYAIALLLRLSIPFKIFSGLEWIQVGTEPVSMGDQYFNKIFFIYKGERIDTSLTIEMGPQWEPWFIIRELYCNAIDEGECNVVPMMDQMYPSEGKTRIYVGITPHIEPVISNWNNYFSTDRIDMFSEVPGVKLFFKKDNSMRVYRKGILVYENPNTEALFDYDVTDADINETRVLTDIYGLRYSLQRIIGMHGDADTLRRIILGLHLAYSKGTVIFEHSMDFTYSMGSNKENWKTAIEGFQFVNNSLTGRYIDEITKDNTLILSGELIHSLKERIDTNIVTFGVAGRGVKSSYRIIPFTEVYKYVLGNAIEFLKDAGIAIDNYEIELVEFDEGNILGGIKTRKIASVDIETPIILISPRAFDIGTKQVVHTLLEEYVHITTKYGDESRELQNYLFSKWVSEMEVRTTRTL